MKSQRFELRLAANEKAIIAKAAKKAAQSVSAFIRGAAVSKALEAK